MSVSAQPQWVIGTPDDKTPQTVQAALKVDTYLVKYVDHEGREQVRLTFTEPQSKATYILAERISGRQVATDSSSWFKAAFDKLVNPEKAKEVEQV